MDIADYLMVNLLFSVRNPGVCSSVVKGPSLVFSIGFGFCMLALVIAVVNV
jgi:hypothetical protein